MVIITGILVFVTMVAIGAAVKYGKQYWLIAGYNTLPKEKQKEVDIEGLAGFMGNCAFILGAFFLAGSVASSLWYAKLFPAVILVYTGGVFYMAIRAQRFVRREKTKGEKRASTFSMAATLLILCGVGAVIIYGQASPQVEVKAEGIVIGGLYGTTIPAEKIREVSLENEIPRIIYRNNGLGYGEIKKGYFTLEGLGRGRLYLESREGPYIFIQTAESYAIINFKDRARTEALYESMAEVYPAVPGP
ncbi:MAG: DUF3784 domain-containing protein [Firmicutes bacterium]|nr:DUF3784 domain-containing protein [Bacillota bacterium]HPU02151.1 DUF3784 domain-containing protein [Bacillota bacterium]